VIELKYKLFNKSTVNYHLNTNDGEIIIPPSDSVVISDDVYYQNRVQRAIETENIMAEEVESNEDTSNNSNEQTDDLESKDRSELMTIASDLDYSDYHDKSIVSATSDELITFIQENS
jgi:hypothetical protein